MNKSFIALPPYFVKEQYKKCSFYLFGQGPIRLEKWVNFAVLTKQLPVNPATGKL